MATYGVICAILFLFTWPVRRRAGFGLWLSLFLIIYGCAVRAGGFAFVSRFEFVIRNEDKASKLMWEVLIVVSDWAINVGLGGIVIALFALRSIEARS